MFRNILLSIFVVSLFCAGMYIQPDLGVYINYIKEKCCLNGICFLEGECFNNLKYLAKRCGSEWNRNCLNNTAYCTRTKLETIIKNCYYYDEPIY